MDKVIIVDDQDIIDSAYNSQTIKREFIRHFEHNKGNIAAGLAEILSGIENVKDIIKPERTFIAKFPKDVLEKINSGQYDIMKTKNGEILSSIIDTTLPKNRNIVHQLRLDEVDPNINEKLKNLSTNVANFALQQQLANLTEMLSQIQSLAIDIKRGQVTDRIGLIISGKNQLEQAMQMKESDVNKQYILMNAIKSLNDGRAQIDLYLRDELNKNLDVPKNKFLLFCKSFINSKFYKDIEKQFGELQESISAYFEATNLLASAYEILDSKEALSKVFMPAKELIEISHERMSELSELALDGIDNKSSHWYAQPQIFINKIDNYSKLILPLSEQNKYVSIKFCVNKLEEENEIE